MQTWYMLCQKLFWYVFMRAWKGQLGLCKSQRKDVEVMKRFSRLVSLLAVMAAVLAFSMASVVAAPADSLNWQDSTITVVGMGAPPANAGNTAQARMMARRAAVVDGYRQMAEIVKGVNVDAETTVENFMVSSDVVRTKVSALVQGAQVVSERATPDGGYEVTMQIAMFGVSNSLAEAVMPRPSVQEVFPEPVESVLPSQPAYDQDASISVRIDVTASVPAPPAATSDAIGGYTGLIVDCRGLGLQPVMSPVIKNASGENIYGHKNLNPDFIIANGMASYTTDIANGTRRAGSNPLVVKAVSLDSHNSYPVLSVADANRVLIENQNAGFLERTSVVFIR